MTTLTLLPALAPTDWRWVSAAPFRAHVRRLLSDSGLPWRALAGHAGVPDRVVRSLLRGRNGRPIRRIAPHYARRLMRLDADELQQTLRALIPADDARHCAHLLLGAGWSLSVIAGVAELNRAEVEALLLGHVTRVPTRAQLLLAAAARAHQLEPSDQAAHVVDAVAAA